MDFTNVMKGSIKRGLTIKVIGISLPLLKDDKSKDDPEASQHTKKGYF